LPPPCPAPPCPPAPPLPPPPPPPEQPATSTAATPSVATMRYRPRPAVVAWLISRTSLSTVWCPIIPHAGTAPPVRSAVPTPRRGCPGARRSDSIQERRPCIVMHRCAPPAHHRAASSTGRAADS